MKRSALFLFLLVASLAVAQTVTFTGTKFQDANGNIGTLNGTISFQPTNQFGQPINGKVGGGGQMSYVPVTCAIHNGAVATGCKLVDTALTAPANIGYTVIWKPVATLVGSKLSQPSALGSYTNVQPQANNSWCTSGTCNFDNFVPNSTNLPLGYSVDDLAVGHLVVTGTCTGCSNASVYWGAILGSLTNQADLVAALALKEDHSALATVAESGSYNDLSSKPTIPAAQIQSDWNQTNNVLLDYIKNKPSLGGVPTWGSIIGTLSDQTDLIGALNGKQASLGFTPENVANKNVASGYAPLDTNALLPATKLPEGAIGKIPIGQGPGTPAVFADPLVQGTQVDGSATEPNPVVIGLWDGTHVRGALGDSNGHLYVNVNGTVGVTGTFYQATQPVSGTFWQTTQPVSISSMPSTPVTGTFWQATQPVSGTFYQATQPISSLQLPTALDGSGFLKTHEQGTVGVTGTFWQATQPISIASTVNVAGTFWQTTQPISSIQLPSALDGSGFLKVAIQNASLAVTGSFYQTTQPVSGTFWQATQPVSIASMPTTAVTGTFYQATQPVSISDGSNVTLGAKADAKSTATDTTAVTAMQVLKEISAMAQSPAALPANQSVNQAQIGGTSIVADPCQTSAKTFISISLTANTQLISGTSAKKIYICSIHLIAAASTNVAIVEGTGTVCATGIAGVGGMGGSTAATGWNFAANGGIVLGNGGYAIGAEGTNADNLCLLVSAANQISGGLSYVAY